MRNDTVIFAQLGIAIALMALAGVAPAQIYRCDTGQTTTFSDQPCDDGAAVHTSVRQISVVEPAADLDRIAERNQAFIRERLDRRAAVRAARAKAARPSQQRPAKGPAHTPAVTYLPFWIEPPRRHHGRQQRPPQTLPEPAQQAFSALSGPFPGSRRSEKAR